MTKQKDYFNAICRVSRAFGSTLDSGELLDLIVQNGIETMDVKAALLFLTNGKEEELLAVAQKGLSEDYVKGGFTAPKQFMPILEKEGFLYSHDASADPRIAGHEAKRKEGISSLLVVPVRFLDRLIGGLCLYTEAPREFSQDEIDFAAALAEQGGMAVKQARLFERIQNNTRIFLDMAANINSSLDVQKIFHILSAEIADLLDVKASSVLLVDESQQMLELVASYGLSESYLDRGLLTIDDSVAETLHGKAVYIEDAAADERIGYKEGKKQEGIASILSVPIVSKQRNIGVLRLYTGAPRRFREDEMMLVTALAEEAGVAIENARLFGRLRNNSQLLLDLAANINSSLDISKIFHILSADIVELLNVKASSILLKDEDKETLELAASYGLGEKYIDRGILSIDDSVAATLEGETVFIKDAVHDDRVAFKDAKREEGIVSILSVPIKTNERVIGVLRIYTGVEREFGEDELMLTQALAYLGGIAIQNASFCLMLKEDMQDLKEEIWFHRSWF